MSLKNLIKENLVLVIGLTLPILLILLFFLATVLPKSMATPPQYELLFSIIRYDYQKPLKNNFEFLVKDRALIVRASKNDQKTKGYNTIKLMMYDGKTESVKEIPLDLSKMGEAIDNSEILLDETKHMVIDSSSTSPDGYVFEGPHYGGGGLVTELFGGGYRNQSFRVKKGGVGYKIPSAQNDYYYNNIQFIGWVVGKK